MTQIVQSNLIYDTETTAVYKGFLKDSAEDVIIKIPKGSDYSGIYNEYNLLIQEDLPCKVYTIEHINTRPALVRSYLPGSTLKSLIEQGEHGPGFFFDYALEITRQLLDVHSRSIIHKDISSYNIIIDPATRQASIIDFESSIKTRSSTASVFESTWLAGNLYYISPEQTGRMNRSIDYRTDYYSLGIVFYEMLTGQLPFQSGDILELVHCHIARNLPRMTSLNPSIPEMLVRIVDRLTTKNAEERYQSLTGLLTDLHRCREEWLSNRTITFFETGQQDFPNHLHISQKMVGREKETDAILTLFDQAAAGKKVFLTVGGLSGVGKSTLINETARPLTRYRGIILRGKFDPLQKNIPYFAWIQAFDQFADQILSQPPEELTLWRNRFRETLQNLDLILVQLVPRLAKLFGQSAELTQLGGVELKNRLHYAIGLFIKVLANADHPLVLFLDDWQWADEDSIRLLTTIRNNPQLSHLMLVAAYRTNEINTVHPFYPLIQDSTSHGEDDVESLVQDNLLLEPLSEEAIHELLRLTLTHHRHDLEELSRITYSKTQGNPFFISQFLTLLYEKRLLWMNAGTHQWEWDIQAIQTMSLSDNVVDIILSKIKALADDTLHTLTIASAAGNTFSLENLSAILDKRPSELHRILWPAVQNNCILPTRNDYKFVPDFYEIAHSDIAFRFAHDRIQQSLYDELDAKKKESLHFDMGKILLSAREDQHRMFEAANHFLKSPALIPGSSSQIEIQNLLQQAGIKAYQSAAFDTSFQYLSLWESLISEHNTDSLPVYWMLIETAHLSNRVTLSASYETKALNLCRRQEERCQTYEIMIRSCTASGQLVKANGITRQALSELNITIPYKAAKWQIIYQAIRSRILISDTKIATISEWPEMTDSRYIWAMRILMVSLASYFLAEYETYPVLIFKMVDLNSRFGKTREAIIGFGSYGLILAGLLNAPESGYMAGKQAMKLLEDYKADELKAQAGFVDTTFIAHWKEPIASLPARCFQNYIDGLGIGDIQYSGWNLYMRSTLQFYVGEKMSLILEGMQGQEAFFRQHNLTNMEQKSVHERYFMHLIRTPQHEDPTFDLERVLNSFHQQNDLTGLFTLYSHHAICSLFLGDYQKAWEMSLLAQKNSDTVKSVFSYHIFSIYQALAALNIYEQASWSEKRKIRKVIRENRKRIGKIAEMQPANYGWGTRLIDAEMERVFNGTFKAEVYYDALEAARRGKMIFPGMMIRLHLVRTMLNTQHPERVDEYMKLRAELLNLEMEGVLASLDGRYPSAMPPPSDLPMPISGSSLRHSNYVSNLQFDTQTFIKSIEALTGELQLDKLLNRLMAFAIENAGADYGCFLLRRNREFKPAVEMYADGDPSALTDAQPSLVPDSILNYVVQSGETLRLENASGVSPFANDPLVIQKKERSVLCIPFINQGQINGVIYLTNRLTENAFTEQRVGLLKLLAGQISLSIENAQLYENLENLVKERTHQLEAEKKKSDRLLLNILPEQVAEELKQSGRARPRYYDQVTIMFCDFKDFTSFAESETPESLIETLDRCFKAFDQIIKRHPIEKIKTIGDAYLCVSGLPQANPYHARDVVNAAMELQEWIRRETIKKGKTGERFLELRIGIHTGPVVAGVVGASKFAYDIWGDAVNTAARMEQSGSAGKINISADTYDIIKEQYECIHRGKIRAKNKGEIDMFFVEKCLINDLRSDTGPLPG